jgi:hypothetical protein
MRLKSTSQQSNTLFCHDNQYGDTTKMKANRVTKLAGAMALALAGAAMSPAQAVNISTSGLGDVHIIPYYTVREGYDTLVHIVNTSDRWTAAVKVRIQEADNSRESRDFNLFLSPRDVWVAAITKDTDGVGIIKPFDNSCIVPMLRNDSVNQITEEGVRFVNWDYGVAGSDDSGDESIERTEDGHVTFFVMGVDDGDGAYDANGIWRADENSIAWYAEHDSDGMPNSCAAIQNLYTGSASGTYNGGGDADAGPYGTGNLEFVRVFSEPLNITKSMSALLNVTEGRAISQPVYTLANFYNPNINGTEDVNNPDPSDQMWEASRISPDFGDAVPQVSSQINEDGSYVGVRFTSGATASVNGRDAVSSLLMATGVINEFGIGGDKAARTDWVINFPTKNLYVDDDENGRTLTDNVPAPFPTEFQDNAAHTLGAPVQVAFNYVDREEQSPVTSPDSLIPSPPPPDCFLNPAACQTNTINWETQTLTFVEEGTEVAEGEVVSALGARREYLVELAEGITSGWMELAFSNAGTLSGAELDSSGTLTGATCTFTGLPVVGYGVKSLHVDDASLNYGYAMPHAYTRDIVCQ